MADAIATRRRRGSTVSTFDMDEANRRRRGRGDGSPGGECCRGLSFGAPVCGVWVGTSPVTAYLEPLFFSPDSPPYPICQCTSEPALRLPDVADDIQRSDCSPGSDGRPPQDHSCPRRKSQ